MNKGKNRTTKVHNAILIPIILMMGFVPLFVHTFQYNANLSQFDWFSAGSDEQVDFFFIWKMIAIIIIGTIMVAVMLYQYSKKKLFQFENAFYPLIFYTLFVCLSAVFSTHKYWLIRGCDGLFEPIWVLLIYIISCYYAYNYVQNEKQLIHILKLAGIGATIVTLIGVFQFFKLDIFKTSFGKHLITDVSMWKRLNEMNFSMPDGTSYTTLYNPNFLSFYFGMLIPLLVCLFIATKTLWKRILLVLAEISCIVCLKGSGSDSGWMALAIGMLILALILISRKKKAFIVALIIIIIGVVGVISFGVQTEIGTTIKNTICGTYHINDYYSLQEVHTGDKDVTLNIKGNDLHVAYVISNDMITINCSDSDEKQLELSLTDAENNIYSIADSRFTEVYVQPLLLDTDEIPGISITVDGVAWKFATIGEEGYFYYNYAQKFVKIDKTADTGIFYDDAMSKRGHIWNMTIPLLGKHIFLGSGANTYMLEYPQDDYIGQAYIYFNSYQVKAHSWYLQQWVETGLIGTLALLIFLGWYIVKSIRIYRRANLNKSITWIGFGIFSAVFIYLIVAIANDSNVCTAPVFWCMLGLGLATNRIITNDEKLFSKFKSQH